MRIAYLTTKYPSVSHTFIRRELCELERRGHHVMRLAIRPSDAPLVDALGLEEFTLTLHCLKQPWRRLLGATAAALLTRRRFWAAARLAVQMGWQSGRGVLRHVAYLVEACYLQRVLRRERAEHVHVHFGRNACAVARLIHRLGGPSYSFTVHGPDEFDAPIGFDLRGKIADAAFVVAITDFCRAQLCRWAEVADWPKIHVVRCAVDDAFFGAAEPLDPMSCTFVSVGRLAPQKGQVLLLDALAEVLRSGHDTRLILVGDGEFRPILEQRIRKLSLQDRVTITGYVSEAEVRRHLLAARALILPSFMEGLPVVIMEAFALNRPVISTYVAGIPELVRPGENGWLVPAGNVEALADAMRAALTAPPEVLAKFGQNGRRAARRQHYLGTEVAQLEALVTHPVAPDMATCSTRVVEPAL